MCRFAKMTSQGARQILNERWANFRKWGMNGWTDGWMGVRVGVPRGCVAAPWKRRCAKTVCGCKCTKTVHLLFCRVSLSLHTCVANGVSE